MSKTRTGKGRKIGVNRGKRVSADAKQTLDQHAAENDVRSVDDSLLGPTGHNAQFGLTRHHQHLYRNYEDLAMVSVLLLLVGGLLSRPTPGVIAQSALLSPYNSWLNPSVAVLLCLGLAAVSYGLSQKRAEGR